MSVAVLVAAGSVYAQTDFEQLSKQALSYVDTNPAQAVQLYKQGLATHPDWPEGWLYMGSCLFKLGRFAEARDALKRGAALEPNKGTPLAFLGMSEYELGNYPAALNDILKGESIGLADNPSFVAAVRYRAAVIYLQRADFVGAMKQLRTLAKLGIGSKEVIDAFGLTVLKIRGQPDNIEQSQRALVELAGQAAWTYEAHGPEDAAKLFRGLVEQFPYVAGVHYLNAVYLITSDPAAAEKEFRQEISISPKNADAHGQLALLLLTDNDNAGAVKEAQEAVNLQPADAWCQATLGRALLQAGSVKEALAALQKSANLAPESSRSHYYLARAYRRVGNTAAAEKEQVLWKQLRAKEEPETIPAP